MLVFLGSYTRTRGTSNQTKGDENKMTCLNDLGCRSFLKIAGHLVALRPRELCRTSLALIISRNLTPDKNGRPEGGRTLEQFKQILRNGTDFDNIHPTCLSDTDPNIALGICVPPPVDGSKLRVMPWPLLHNMTDHQIEAIYAYLSVIPCIDNNFAPPPAGAPNELRHDCGSSDASLIPRDAAFIHGNARANARK
jgi:hypothetical protein